MVRITTALVSLTAFFAVSLFLNTQSTYAAPPHVTCVNVADRFVCGAIPQTQPTFLKPVENEDSTVADARYIRLDPGMDIYTQPDLGAPIKRTIGDGFLYASVLGIRNDAAGNVWYWVNSDEWILASIIQEETRPTQFRGVEIGRNPERPFGWVVAGEVRPSREPDGEPDLNQDKLLRYDFIEVFDAVEDDEGWYWYRVGPDRWIRQTEVSLVTETERPNGVGDDDYWVSVDLYEQTLAAYEGDEMVYSTLVSTGVNSWPTYEGLYEVELRLEATKMSGAEGEIDYYFVEDVPHTMFFDMTNEIALHGAYWHDRFGYKHSHGCVNMPPQDSEWVYDWSLGSPAEELQVYVYTSSPDTSTNRYDYEDPFAGP